LHVKKAFYVHSGGTKYYILYHVAIQRGSLQWDYVINNYGKYSGDTSRHHPRKGGTSGLEGPLSAHKANGTFQAACEKRRKRDYVYIDAASRETSYEAADLEALDSALTNAEVMTGHVMDMIARMKDDWPDLAGAAPGPAVSSDPPWETEVAPAAVERGEEWGSW
jgi:hypothetical protein